MLAGNEIVLKAPWYNTNALSLYNMSVGLVITLWCLNPSSFPCVMFEEFHFNGKNSIVFKEKLFFGQNYLITLSSIKCGDGFVI